MSVDITFLQGLCAWEDLPSHVCVPSVPYSGPVLDVRPMTAVF